MWYEINHITFMIDPTWCDMYATNCQVCDTKSSRNSTRCRKHERTSTYTAVRDFPVYILNTKKLYRMICTKNDLNWMICQVCDTKSTTWCSSSISHDVICIPRTARYVCDTKSSRNSTIYRKRERTSTYTAVRDFPVYFEYEKTVPYDMHKKWFKLNDLPGMWYEINHIAFMIDPTRCDMCTTNCQVCDTKSSSLWTFGATSGIACVKHTSRYGSAWQKLPPPITQLVPQHFRRWYRRKLPIPVAGTYWYVFLRQVWSRCRSTNKKYAVGMMPIEAPVVKRKISRDGINRL